MYRWSSEEDICEEADGIDAMKLALETWAGWVSASVDPQKQQVFFVTMSPTHLWWEHKQQNLYYILRNF